MRHVSRAGSTYSRTYTDIHAPAQRLRSFSDGKSSFAVAADSSTCLVSIHYVRIGVANWRRCVEPYWLGDTWHRCRKNACDSLSTFFFSLSFAVKCALTRVPYSTTTKHYVIDCTKSYSIYKCAFESSRSALHDIFPRCAKCDQTISKSCLSLRLPAKCRRQLTLRFT